MDQTERAMDVSLPFLEGHFVRLRSITQEDYGFLWECRCHPDIMHLWMGGRNVPSFEQYAQELDTAFSGQILTLQLIETQVTRRPVGFVYAYDHNPYDRCVFWSVALHPAYTNIGWGAEASLLFLEYLFSFFDLRNAYCEVYAFNQHSSRLLLRMGAREEARFTEHRYYQGSYYDVMRLTITPEIWRHARKSLLAIIAKRSRITSQTSDSGREYSLREPQTSAKTPAVLTPLGVSTLPTQNGNQS